MQLCGSERAARSPHVAQRRPFAGHVHDANVSIANKSYFSLNGLSKCGGTDHENHVGAVLISTET